MCDTSIVDNFYPSDLYVAICNSICHQTKHFIDSEWYLKRLDEP